VALIGVDVSGCRRAIAACAAFALAIGGIAFAQAAEKTIRDQVYSETQAARGKSVYDKQCYLIRANGFPAGSKAFESPNELNTIKIVRSK
jgi:hypothetical protein